jgi:hypothetical protein
MKSKHLTLLALFLLSVSLFACGDDDGTSSVDIRGLTAEEAAAVSAEAICNQSVRCGAVSYECSSDGQTTTCTGTIEPVQYQECYLDLEPEMRGDFEGCELTEAQALQANDCVNAMADAPCLTQAQVDANAAAREVGDDPPYGGELPVACEQIGAVFEACDATTV